LNFEVVSEIISHESLRLGDEDSFYKFIKNLVYEESRYSNLFEFIRFEYLSCESRSSFIEVIGTSFEFRTFSIWQALCRRLALPVSPKTSNDRVVNLVIYSFDASSPLNGIISYLTKKFGGHVEDRGVVSVSASSVGNAHSYPLRHVADFENQTCFSPNNELHLWICYDFKNMHIKPIHYSPRSICHLNCYHLRYWTLE
jgi:hypothetical protein